MWPLIIGCGSVVSIFFGFTLFWADRKDTEFVAFLKWLNQNKELRDAKAIKLLELNNAHAEEMEKIKLQITS